MSQKQVKRLRRGLVMTKENFRQKEHKRINPVTKIVYFRNALGDLTPVEVTRSQVINTNLNFYRRAKKQLKRG